MLELGAQLELRDLDKQALREDELEALIGHRDYKAFLNPRNQLYRAGHMGENPPARREAIRLLSANPNLIKRPVVVRGDRLVLGFDEEAYRRLLK